MNKVLNVVDALDGLIADEHVHELSGIAKFYLKAIIGGSDGDGHGHNENGCDRDPDLEPVRGPAPQDNYEGAGEDELVPVAPVEPVVNVG